jgi:hypothetical protein
MVATFVRRQSRIDMAPDTVAVLRNDSHLFALITTNSIRK